MFQINNGAKFEQIYNLLMKVKYIKDFEYDTLMIWMMLSQDDPSGVENRAKSMGVSATELSKIYGVEDYQEVKSFLEQLVTKKYKEHEEHIDAIIPQYQNCWDKINDSFSSEVERITKIKWHHKVYDVVVSPFHPGISNNGGDTVVRSAFEEPEGQTRITAHEILMSHIWTIFYDKFPESQNDPLMHFWGLNEITTVAVLGLEPSVNALWREKEKGYDNYLKNYPQLKPLMNKLKTEYFKVRDFEDFLKIGVRFLSSEEYRSKNLLF